MAGCFEHGNELGISQMTGDFLSIVLQALDGVCDFNDSLLLNADLHIILCRFGHLL